MQNHFALFFLIFGFFEIINFFNFKKIIKSNLIIYKKFLKIIYYKKVTDHWKELSIIKYAQILFISSIKIFVIIIILIIYIYLLNKIFVDFLIFIFEIKNIIVIFLYSILYYYFRKLIYDKLFKSTKNTS